ncbi:MAG: hypothetical protein ABIH72_01250 [archaeon]
MKIGNYFIIGAEGVGKSSVLEKIKKAFPKIDTHDFDELGVPLNPTIQWRLNTTLYWLKKAIENQKKDIQTCIIGLCFPKEIKNMVEFKKLEKITFCLLDVNEKERGKRLANRGSSQDVIEDLENLMELRKQIKQVRGRVIDTSDLPIEEVLKEIVKFIGEENKR